MLNIFICYYYLVKVYHYFNFYFIVGLSVSTLIWGKAARVFENADPHFAQAKLRSLKVLPPHGVWVTEASAISVETRRGDHFFCITKLLPALSRVHIKRLHLNSQRFKQHEFI